MKTLNLFKLLALFYISAETGAVSWEACSLPVRGAGRKRDGGWNM